ncbi:MAG: hypothetical protein ACOC2J_03210 [bacterium]
MIIRFLHVINTNQVKFNKLLVITNIIRAIGTLDPDELSQNLFLADSSLLTLVAGNLFFDYNGTVQKNKQKDKGLE